MWVTDFYGISFDFPDGWLDVTEDLDGQWPPTLAREVESGVIQFSIARYSGGKNPDATVEHLRTFCTGFCQKNGIDAARVQTYSANLECVGVVPEHQAKFMAAWYLSNGRDFIFVTYIAFDLPSGQVEEECAAALSLVRTIDFTPVEWVH